jgi:RNA polymerase sigma-70 factor (ECF subfamily)
MNGKMSERSERVGDAVEELEAIDMDAASNAQESTPNPESGSEESRHKPNGRVRTEGADADLERLWLTGDDRAIAETHQRYRARLEAVSFRVVKNYADAEDVVARIFLTLKRASYRGDSSLWTYLYRAAVNGSVNMLRSKRRRENAERRLLEARAFQSQPAPKSGEAAVLESQIISAVSKALLQVKPQHRRVLSLRIMHGMNNTEIAEAEDLPLPTVGTWLRRGREELQRALKPLMNELRKKGESS